MHRLCFGQNYYLNSKIQLTVSKWEFVSILLMVCSWIVIWYVFWRHFEFNFSYLCVHAGHYRILWEIRSGKISSLFQTMMEISNWVYFRTWRGNCVDTAYCAEACDNKDEWLTHEWVFVTSTIPHIFDPCLVTTNKCEFLWTALFIIP